jgi:hypothetical protein
MLTYPQAVQAIAALEARTADFEGRLAAGKVTADDAELVIRDCASALLALRREYDIEFPSIAALYAEVFQDRRTERMQDAAWELHKAEFDRMQAADPEDPSRVWHEVLDR